MTAAGASRWTMLPALLLVGVPACRPAPPAFTDRVWQVGASSAVERGMLYVFLGDGTLLIASAHGTPSLGRWVSADKRVVLIEEGLRHPADILSLTADTFRIRVRSPGEPVDITFVPAK